MAQNMDKGRPGVFFTFAELAASRLAGVDGTVVLIAKNYAAPAVADKTYIFTSSRQARDTLTNAKADAAIQAFDNGASRVIVRTVASSPTQSDYEGALAALATEQFQVLTFDHEIADASVAIFADWLADERDENDRYVFLVLGGNAARDADPDLGIAAALAHKDDFIVQPINAPVFDGTTRSSGLYAPSLAGQIASAKLGESFTFKEIPDAISVNRPLSPADIKAALAAGAFVFEYDGELVRTVRGGVTSGSKIRKSLLKQTMTRDIKREVERNWIGKKSNGPVQQLSLRGVIEKYVNQLVKDELIADGFVLNVTRPEGAAPDQVAVELNVKFQDTMEEVYVSVGFIN